MTKKWMKISSLYNTNSQMCSWIGIRIILPKSIPKYLITSTHYNSNKCLVSI